MGVRLSGPATWAEDEVKTGDFFSSLNELGAQGWELVSEHTLDTFVGSGHGLENVGFPIMMKWTFKRPIDEGRMA